MADSLVRDIMTPAPLTVSPDTVVTEAAQIMVDAGVGALPVVEDGKLVGLVTEGDLIGQDLRFEYPTYIHLLDGFITYPPSTTRFQHELRTAAKAPVRDVMTPDPVTVQAAASIEEVAAVLVGKDVSRLPVLDGEVLVGIVSKVGSPGTELEFAL